ncbi:hypothetical protein BPOR_0023g00320 [Botrytis porri]|uniref:Uncharacterized protein n=1 Tax=Botrytis porri TaxID=87229 RepID=A0A4Z1L4I8_9HELO|nr:hypothetical protein BPOR_0023g00320 [Botrytis porri]
MCLATMLIALKANLDPTVLVNLGMGLLVLILAFVGACCRQVYIKHAAKEPLLLTVEPKSVKFIKTEVETEKRFNVPGISGYTEVKEPSYSWVAC